MRQVVHVDRYKPERTAFGSTSVKMTLECGHVTYQKGSIKVPRKTHCRECENPSVWGKTKGGSHGEL